ncbi:MAG TPA: glutamate dehydrogenase, partial [Myxococcales bacterium]|nr:glutamate dehydrogenase [Myxococcales bacterium]
ASGCRAISEGANMPSTAEAIAAFHDAKVLFAPGKASNAGGVGVSGLEQSQNALRLAWSAEEVDNRLQEMMKGIHEQCVAYGTDEGGYVNYVDGANIAGFVKVAEAMLAYGIV